MGRPLSFVLVAAVLALALALSGCAAAPITEPTPAATDTGAAPGDAGTAVTHELADAVDEALRDELLQLLEEDQAERLEGADFGGDAPRTERLAEIIEASGWPGYSLVGEEAEDAAWAIAQHSDQDVGFQQIALAHLAAAVDAEDASPGNLAYLTDRVAVNLGEDQTYGTQIACGEDGPTPVVPIADEASVDERRADASLPPLADYYAELEEVCGADF